MAIFNSYVKLPEDSSILKKDIKHHKHQLWESISDPFRRTKQHSSSSWNCHCVVRQAKQVGGIRRAAACSARD